MGEPQQQPPSTESQQEMEEDDDYYEYEDHGGPFPTEVEVATDTEHYLTDEEGIENPPELPYDADVDYDSFRPTESDMNLSELQSSEFDLDPEHNLYEDGLGDADFIKHPLVGSEWKVGDMPTDDQLDSSDEEEQSSSIHISQMQITTEEQAREMAEKVILQLEEDVVEHFQKAGIDMDTLDTSLQETLREKISGSSISVSSHPSLPLPGEPSKLRLFYEKGENIAKNKNLPHIRQGVDEQCEVILHRSRKWKKGKPPEYTESGTQTKQMAFVPENKAQLMFMDLYPKPDDWVAPEVPTRQRSMEEAMLNAAKEDPQVDRTRLKPQIISFTNRKKILPPLRDDYYKDETFWTGSRFQGEYKNRQFFKGHYDHPTGVKYESEWKDGHFHTEKHLGIMEYPRGDTFEGTWIQGRHQHGEITFGDGLKYTTKNWSYLENDRRLRIERYYGMKPAGETLYNDQNPQFKLPVGLYDVGEGVYDPKTREIRGYDGFLMRVVKQAEHQWICRHCRKTLQPDEQYIPTFNPERIPGASMHQVHRLAASKHSFNS